MERISEVFKWRQQTFTVTPNDSEYTLRYLGSMRTLRSRGDNCCDYPIKKIWKNTACGERYVKAKMFLGTKGIRLVRADISGGEKKGEKEQFFHLSRITCCTADQQQPTVFAWIYRHELPRLQVSLRVHVAVCCKEEKAREIATTITCMYQTAFELFKRDKLISARRSDLDSSPTSSQNNSPIRTLSERSWSVDSSDDDDDDGGDSRSMTDALPPTPLRRIINQRCAFKPSLALRLSLQSKMLLVIRESQDESKENAAVRYGLSKLGVLDSPTTLKRKEEKFEDFQPADVEI